MGFYTCQVPLFLSAKAVINVSSLFFVVVGMQKDFNIDPSINTGVLKLYKKI